mmetsp:Transcript_145020/g.361742  ORF Transcript_145020/g.361742 Transcript_145020/m.361742 type:complete len:405 (+) Transcript_145020:889-2103(+)
MRRPRRNPRHGQLRLRGRRCKQRRTPMPRHTPRHHQFRRHGHRSRHRRISPRRRPSIGSPGFDMSRTGVPAAATSPRGIGTRSSIGGAAAGVTSPQAIGTRTSVGEAAVAEEAKSQQVIGIRTSVGEAGVAEEAKSPQAIGIRSSASEAAAVAMRTNLWQIGNRRSVAGAAVAVVEKGLLVIGIRIVDGGFPEDLLPIGRAQTEMRLIGRRTSARGLAEAAAVVTDLLAIGRAGAEMRASGSRTITGGVAEVVATLRNLLANGNPETLMRASGSGARGMPVGARRQPRLGTRAEAKEASRRRAANTRCIGRRSSSETVAGKAEAAAAAEAAATPRPPRMQHLRADLRRASGPPNRRLGSLRRLMTTCGRITAAQANLARRRASTVGCSDEFQNVAADSSRSVAS